MSNATMTATQVQGLVVRGAPALSMFMRALYSCLMMLLAVLPQLVLCVAPDSHGNTEPWRRRDSSKTQINRGAGMHATRECSIRKREAMAAHLEDAACITRQPTLKTRRASRDAPAATAAVLALDRV